MPSVLYLIGDVNDISSRAPDLMFVHIAYSLLLAQLVDVAPWTASTAICIALAANRPWPAVEQI